MKTKAIALFLLGFIPAFAQDIPTSKTEQNMDRIERCKKNYTELFGGEALTGQGTDPEMMDILQKFIFGEVFRTGDLDKKDPGAYHLHHISHDANLAPTERPRQSGAKRRRHSHRATGGDIPMRSVYRFPEDIECLKYHQRSL